jgi:hypothetical protein
VSALAALVERFAPDFPDRVDEWRMYLAYLQDYADPDGTLPSSFDGLVSDVYGPLLESPQLASRAGD